ncbi:MAG: HAMP domain-containing protein [Planctomycetota bacterium]|nr:MAG: HAMP domain-containing protein [Planctomycetota bacterium]
MNGDPRGARWWRSAGLARRFGVYAALLVLLFVAIAWLVINEVRRVDTDLAKMFEENREALLTHDLAIDLAALETPFRESAARERGAASVLDAALLARARGTLAELRRGPQGEDPSGVRHQSEEDVIFAQLESDLRALESADFATRGPAERVSDAGEQARRLDAVMRTEFERAESAVLRRADRVRVAVLALVLTGLAVLGALSALVALRIIGPLQRLRAGAQRLGRGELSLRLDDEGRDEIGALTRELNHMAGELEASRSDLQRRVEERTRELMRAARLADLGTLAAGIAHEINNPLASIASSAEGLQRRVREGRVSAAEQNEYLEVIAKEAYRVHEITQRMLAFARNEPAGRAPFRPGEALAETRTLLEHHARRRDVRVELDVAPDLPLFRGVEAHWRQLVLNLLLNAIDAAPRQSAVEVRCHAGHGQLVLEVRDRGAGVAAADVDRIFDPFFTTKQPGQGTGLGLAIVHRVVEEHGGSIEVLDAEPGAVFRVRLPLEPDERA